jgi:hypothetical protein
VRLAGGTVAVDDEHRRLPAQPSEDVDVTRWRRGGTVP